jgi:hypothetical protein
LGNSKIIYLFSISYQNQKMKTGKKIIALVLVIAFVGSFLTSCRSSKTGCPVWSIEISK